MPAGTAPFGELSLALARQVVVDEETGRAERQYGTLRGDGLMLPLSGLQLDDRDERIQPGWVVLAGKVAACRCSRWWCTRWTDGSRPRVVPQRGQRSVGG